MSLSPAKIKALAAEAAKFGPDLRYPTPGESDDDEGGYEIEIEPGVFHVVSSKDPDTDAKQRAARLKTALKAQGELNAELKQWIKARIATDPERFKGLKASGNIQVLPRSDGRTRKTYEQIVQRVLTHQGARETQAAINAHIRMSDPESPALKDWTKLMPKFAIESLRKKIQASGAPFNQIRITSKITLAELHRKAARLLAKEGAEIKTTILVTSDRVFIGDKSWRIGTATANGQTYRRINIRVDHLLDLHKPSARSIAGRTKIPLSEA
jgi:hypothetical protein